MSKYFLFLLTINVILPLITHIGGSLSREWTLNEINDLIHRWQVPNNFEICIYSAKTRFFYIGSNTGSDRALGIFSMTTLNGSSAGAWLRKRPFQLIFHLLKDTSDLHESFVELKTELALPLKSIRGDMAGTSRYHFLLWPNSSTPEYSICSQLEPYLGSIPLQSHVYVLKKGMVLEMFSIQRQKYCGALEVSGTTHFWKIPEFEFIAATLPRRQNFTGVSIISTAVADKKTDFEVRYEEKNGSVVSAAGLAVNLIKDLEFRLGFKAQYIYGDWVMQNKDGLPTGLTVQQLQDGSADIYITQATLTPYRAIGFTYIQPTFQDNIVAFVRQPPSSSIHDVHISPFQGELWIVAFCIWLLLALSSYCFAYVRHGVTASTSRVPSFCKYDQLQEAFLWSIGTACNKGWYTFPKYGCTRLLIFTGSMTGLLVLYMYSGSIISAITCQTSSIQSFPDLVKSSLDIYADPDSSTIQKIVKHYRYIALKKRPIISEKEATSLKTVLKRPAAILGFARNIYRTAGCLNITNQKLCERLSKLPLLKLPVLNGMLVSATSPFRETFNYNIIQLKEYGLVDRYMTHFAWDYNPSCAEKKVLYRDNLGIQDVVTAYALLAFGLVACLLILLLECRRKRREI